MNETIALYQSLGYEEITYTLGSQPLDIGLSTARLSQSTTVNPCVAG
jgi:hypothetical protein